MKRPTTSEQVRRRAYRRGLVAETLAAWSLRLKGFRVLDHRARTPFGEIDLIAARGNLVVFVEVKQRRDRQTAIHSLRPHQQARITRAAHSWLAHHPTPAACNYRFDMIVVQPYLWPMHIADAFPAAIGGYD